MMTDGNHKPGSVKMGYFALKFLFTNVYHKDWANEYLPTPKIAKTLPLVLSQSEVRDVNEFIRRFLLHILPVGFFKIRYYGIFSNRFRKENIQKSKQLLNDEKLIQKHEDKQDGIQTFKKQKSPWTEILNSIETYKKPNCPKCKKGYLSFAGIVPVEKITPG